MTIASVPSGNVATTGLRMIASVERIATCGWLMIGNVSTEPADPLFEIVNVPPEISSGQQLLRPWPASARSWISRAMAPSRLPSAPRMIGHDEALVVEVDRDAEIDEPVDQELVARDARIEVRELLERIDDGRG